MIGLVFGVCCLWVYVCFFAISGWVVNLIVWLVGLGNLLVCLCLTWRVVSGFIVVLVLLCGC